MEKTSDNLTGIIESEYSKNNVFMKDELTDLLNSTGSIVDYSPRIIKTSGGYDLPCKLPRIYKNWRPRLSNNLKFREIINGKIKNFIANMDTVWIESIDLKRLDRGLSIQIHPGVEVESYVNASFEYSSHNIKMIQEANIILLVLQLYIPELINFLELCEKGTIKFDEKKSSDSDMGKLYHIDLINIRKFNLPYISIPSFFPEIRRVPGGYSMKCELPMIYQEIIPFLTTNEEFRSKVEKELGWVTKRKEYEGIDEMQLVWYKYALDFVLIPENAILECHPNVPPYNYENKTIKSYEHVQLLQDCLLTYLKILWNEMAKYAHGDKKQYGKAENSILDQQNNIITILKFN